MTLNTESQIRPKFFETSRTELHQWNADNERLLRAALQPTGPGPLDHDEITAEAVQQRFFEMFGELMGLKQYQIFLGVFPERNKEFFPELYDEDGNELF